jgi:hypothetical protein
LLHAYSDAGNTTLYRPLLKTYFTQLQARYTTTTTPSNTALDASSSQGPAVLLAAAAASGKADMASLPRAHISDMGSLTAPIFHPASPTRTGGAPLSPLAAAQQTTTDLASYYQQQAAALGPTPSLAVGQALTQWVPSVRRERAFVAELFRLRPEEVEDDQG